MQRLFLILHYICIGLNRKPKNTDMKKILCVSAAVAAALMASCSSADLTRHGRAPESIGPLTVDRERIGTGQPFTATCIIPADGENISSTEYSWYLAAASPEAAAATRASHPWEPAVIDHTFTAPATAGKYTIECTVRYLFKGPDLEGNIYRDVKCEMTIDVVACDVLNSFWGDSMEETKLNYDDLTEKGAEALAGLVCDPVRSGRPPLVTGFRFTGNKLGRIMQAETISPTKENGLYMYYLLLQHDILNHKNLMLTLDGAVIKWSDGTTETPDLDNDRKDKEKQNRIDEGIKSGEASISAGFHNDRYRLTVNVQKTDEGIAYDRLYEPRG